MGSCVSCCGTAVSHTVQLPDQLETGDLILFRTKSIAAAVTRWCTDAPFDHVAMVLRTSEGYRTVECTGQGIGCWVLQERLDDHIIKGVVIRRLQTVLTNEMVDNLNKFLQSVKHKPYRLNQTILQRMVRTCLCCQRAGQNERGLEESPRASQRSSSSAAAAAAAASAGTGGKSAGKYAVSGSPGGSGDGGAGDDEAKEGEFALEDGQVPIPPLLPPREESRRGRRFSSNNGAGGGSVNYDLRSPSVAASAGQVQGLAGGGGGAAASSHSGAALSTPSSPAHAHAHAHPHLQETGAVDDSSSAAAVAGPGPVVVSGADLLSRKCLSDLREHESIRSHYPHAEDIASLHTRGGFFCSSFVAACYMKMGLLPAYPPIDWYLPASFSSRSAIQAPLLGAEFGEEVLLEKPSQDRRENKWTNVQKQAQRAQDRQKHRQQLLQRERDLLHQQALQQNAALAQEQADQEERQQQGEKEVEEEEDVELAHARHRSHRASPTVATAAAAAAAAASSAPESWAAAPSGCALPAPLRTTEALEDDFEAIRSHSRSAHQRLTPRTPAPPQAQAHAQTQAQVQVQCASHSASPALRPLSSPSLGNGHGHGHGQGQQQGQQQQQQQQQHTVSFAPDLIAPSNDESRLCVTRPPSRSRSSTSQGSDHGQAGHAHGAFSPIGHTSAHANANAGSGFGSATLKPMSIRVERSSSFSIATTPVTVGQVAAGCDRERDPRPSSSLVRAHTPPAHSFAQAHLPADRAASAATSAPGVVNQPGECSPNNGSGGAAGSVSEDRGPASGGGSGGSDGLSSPAGGPPLMLRVKSVLPNVPASPGSPQQQDGHATRSLRSPSAAGSPSLGSPTDAEGGRPPPLLRAGSKSQRLPPLLRAPSRPALLAEE